MKKAFLKSVTKPDIKFEILSRDKETNVMKLRGQWSEFEETVTKEWMDKFKYTIVIEEVA
jgi:hypothetical protein